MKITWFGGATFRLHVSGQIIVTYPADAPVGVNRLELESGADRVVDLVDPPPSVLNWRPRTASAPIDDPEGPAIEIVSLPEAGLGISAVGESPIILADTDWGGVKDFLQPRPRWAHQAIVVLYSSTSSEDSLANGAEAVLTGLAPRLIAIAGNDHALNRVWGALANHLDGTGLVALEQGLALEA